MLFKEVIAVYSENNTKSVNNAALLIVKAGGTYKYISVKHDGQFQLNLMMHI
jgi:hypothetical protein